MMKQKKRHTFQPANFGLLALAVSSALVAQTGAQSGAVQDRFQMRRKLLSRLWLRVRRLVK